MTSRSTLSTRQPEHTSGPASVLPVISAGTLFGKNRELLIEHAGSQYRLRITQNNKLILTK
jgi:hemin uptake protein HemP